MPTTLSPTDHYVQINGLSLHYVDWGGDSNRNPSLGARTRRDRP